MRPIPLKVARIGNSRGVRLPAATLERYRISDVVVMEERSDGILLRPQHSAGQKLSWEATADAMASSREDWTEWDGVAADGLNDIPWELGRKRGVAERPTPPDGTKSTQRKKRS